ncbi:MAG: hypothetical protein ACQESE_00400 [Nanobdellota archaeon]
MVTFHKRQLFVIGLMFLVFFTVASQASAVDIAVANSEDWKDVYSVMMMSSLEGQRGFFLNSDSITGFTKVISERDTIQVYESNTPYINNLESQLSSVNYDAELVRESSQLNLDLDPQTGNYYVISADNPRISVSLAPLALKENAWVLIVDNENVAQVAGRLENADSVTAVGNFKRSVLEEIEDTFTERINNDDLFKDSQDIATRFGVEDSIVLADGSFIEVEFFNQKNPVLLSGHNKILDDTYTYLEENDIKSVVIVGNKLSVIGEQIRSSSNKSISVFIKFGQSDTSNTGTVYALTMFPLPKPKIALTVEKAMYDPEEEQLIARFKNLGTAGIYELSTIAIKNGEQELASASDDEVRYLAAGEVLPVPFNISLSPEDITNETKVEFYTSFGVYPSQLDTFLTMENKFGPPFSIPLSFEDLEDDGTKIELEDAAYYKGLNRVGVTLLNNGSEKAYVSVKVHDIIINGLEETLYKNGEIAPGQSKTLYMPVSLDKVDIEENDQFSLVVMYGADENLMLKNIRADYPFKVVAGLSTTLIIIVIVILLLIVGGLFYFKKKKPSEKGGAKQVKEETQTTTKKSSKKVAKKASKKSSKKTTKKSSKKASKKGAKKSSKKAVKKASKKTKKKR